MKKILLLLLIIMSIASISYAQNSKIAGLLTDTLGAELIGATILLMDEDSTMVDFTQSDSEGKYSFEKVAQGNYLIKYTYVGYFPHLIRLEVNKPQLDLDPIKLSEISTILMEVVVKAAKAPLKMRGDTVEFDISQFKVPENSTLEELLRRLPGMQVDQSGALKSDGVDVTTVKVDGKNFFGNNPTMATKNLPAESVSSVQVYDRKTDEQVATGNTTPATEKEMNVVLKDDFKNIMFGKGTIGGGNLERLEGKLSINKFTPLHQFSILGVGNNTGRNGLGWDDREDFFGAQAYNFGNTLKYGFNSMGGMNVYYFTNDDNLNLESKISGLFASNYNGGLPKNGTAGINYNYEGEKVQIGSRYVINHRGNDVSSFRSSNRLLPNNVTNLDTTTSSVVNGSTVNRIEASFSGEIDSFNTVKVFVDFGNIVSSNNNLSQGISYRNKNELISQSTIDNKKKENGLIGSGTVVYNKTFRKKGRFIGLNATYTKSGLTENTSNNSDLLFTQATDRIINQDFNNDFNKKQIQGNATISEPIGKKFFAGIFHNFDQTIQDGDIQVNDLFDGVRSINTDLTRTYQTEVMYNFSGASLRFSHKGLNTSVGYGHQFTDLYGDFLGLDNNSGRVDTTFSNPAYFGNLSYQFTRSSYSGLSYNRTITAPSIGQLTPVINNVNPLYIREGNPNLEPEIGNAYSAYFSTSKPLTNLRFYGNLSFSNKQNAITQAEEVTESLITTTRPINYKTSQNSSLYTSLSIPISGNKVNMTANFNTSTNASYRLVNDVENKTNTINYRPGLGLNITPNENVSIYLNSNYSVSKTKYSINTGQNQNIINQNHRVTASFKLAKSLYFNGNYNHQFYKNERFGENTDIPIINISLNKQFLPGNKGEIRIAAYDILNKNQIYNLSASSNTVSQSNTVALARYFMVSFSYNIKGMKAGASSQY